MILEMGTKPKVIDKGAWDKNISWELFAGSEVPDTILCTAVFCVAIVGDKILLMRAKRGWDMLGGHVEPTESIEEALEREALEEGGFIPHNPTLFGYRKLLAIKPVLHQDGENHYPFPVSYIAYYWATTIQPIVATTGSEVLESKLFTINEIRKLNLPDLSVIELGLQSYSSN